MKLYRGAGHQRGEADALNNVRQVSDRLVRHGRILGVVDRRASIGASPVAVALACQQAAYPRGLAMRRDRGTI